MLKRPQKLEELKRERTNHVLEGCGLVVTPETTGVALDRGCPFPTQSPFPLPTDLFKFSYYLAKFLYV